MTTLNITAIAHRHLILARLLLDERIRQAELFLTIKQK